MAGKVDRQRRTRLRQQTMHRPPAVKVGAEAVQEHDRRALAPLQPQPMDIGRARRGGRRRLDVAPLNAAERSGAAHALKPQAALARDPPGGGRRARALAAPHPAPYGAVRKAGVCRTPYRGHASRQWETGLAAGDRAPPLPRREGRG